MKLQFTPIKCALVLSLFIGGTTLLCAENTSANTTQTRATNAISITSIIQPDDGLFKLKENQEEIIAQCLTFKPLLDKIPTDVKDKMSEFYILNHGIAFNLPSNFKISNKKTSLITKQDINKNKPYFLFHTLHISNNKAFVKYNLIYSRGGVETTIPVTIEFVKKDTLWQVLNSKF